MMKKLSLIIAAVLVLFAFSACNGNGGNTSSEEPSSNPPVSITLTAEQQTAFDDFLSALSVRISYLNVEIKRDYTEGDVTLNTVLSFFQPQGPGYFTFDKLTKKNGEVYLVEHFGGTSSYTFTCEGETVAIPQTGFAGPILERIASDEITHTRIKLGADFDYEDLIITAFSHSVEGEIVKVDVSFDGANDGELLKEYGEKGEYIAKNIRVKAEFDGSETLLKEEITYTLVKVADGSEIPCRIYTETAPDVIDSLPDSTQK